MSASPPKGRFDEEKLGDLREALLQCTTVSPNSEAMRFALKTIDDVRQGKSASCRSKVKAKAIDTDTNPDDKNLNSTPKKVNGKIQSKKQFSILHTIFVLVRFLIIEFPLVMVFTLAMCAQMLSHVYEEYIDPQFDLMTYTDQNRTQDRTYYHRCELIT